MTIFICHQMVQNIINKQLVC